ncbi:MAG: hypothetical protein ACJ762_21520 [Solirubrobacteraceae bacterium]
MGFFKSINELNKQAKEMDKTFHPGQMMADGQAKMAAATAMMAAQTQAANASANGLDATATVVALRQGTAMINMQPLVEIDLTVIAPGRPPYPATVKQVIDQVSLARLTPGSSVAVKVDPVDAGSVWIDLMRAIA